MSAVREVLQLLIAKGPSFLVRIIPIADIAGFVSVLLFAVLFDRTGKRNLSRYGQRSFRVDLIYALFYLCGIYTFFVGLPLFRLLTRVFDSLFARRGFHIGNLPIALQVVIGLVAVDLFSYGWHRSVHGNRVLWAFHSVHHSQQYLTVATGFRTHFIDEIVRTTFMFVPLYFLGIRPHTFLFVDLAVNWILGLQHSDLSWSYGFAGRAIVSPRYHRMHHSLDPADRDKNFAVLFPFWDRLFGTYTVATTRPLRYGLDAPGYPESFVRQLAWPFLVAARSLKQRGPQMEAAAPIAAIRNPPGIE